MSTAAAPTAEQEAAVRSLHRAGKTTATIRRRMAEQGCDLTPAQVRDIVRPPTAEADGLFGKDARSELGSTLAERYGAPPLTVLRRDSTEWRTRKRQWLSLGIKSELGRVNEGEAAAFRRETSVIGSKGTELLSVFDPVLCELAYTWWSPPGGRILDNFAGGSVRGIVAAKLGRHYTGVDLRADQVEANREQVELLEPGAPTPRWYQGDAAYLSDALPEGEPPYDFAFTCPPYYDLEVYSDHARDLSNAGTYAAFLTMYRQAIEACVQQLRHHSFCAIVVGDVRGKDGCYHGLVVDTVDAYLRAGCKLYNEAALVDPYGTAPQRAAALFEAGRKLIRVHQTLLVFVKGDWRRAAEACKGIEVADTSQWQAQERLFRPADVDMDAPL